MPVPWQRQAQASGTTAVTVATTTETIVQTLANLSTDGPNQLVLLEGFVALTSGTATTTVTVRLRRGTAITSTLVGVAVVEILIGAAGNTAMYSIAETDSPGEVASQSYVLTVQQAAATGNGATVAQALLATIF